LIASVKKSNVPESVPGPYRASSASNEGSSPWISFQFLTVDFGSQTDLSWSTVRQVTGLFGLTTTVSASFAT